jgi:hypothetical protein
MNDLDLRVGFGRRFVHTRWCRIGCPQIRLGQASGGVGGVRVVPARGVWSADRAPNWR